MRCFYGKKKLFILLFLILISSCSYKVPYQPYQKTECQKCPENKNIEIMDFVKQISNIPSPTSNLKYIKQENNLFEIKYGDGLFMILSNDSYPFKIDCKDGSSMLPTFKCNDKIILKSVMSRGELNVGDIIVYKFNDSLFIHRLIKIEGNKYHTRKDNLDNSLKYISGILDINDAVIEFEQIKYKVVGIIYN